MPTDLEEFHDELREDADNIRRIANRAYIMSHSNDTSVGDRNAMELVGGCALNLIVAIGRLR